MVKNALQNRLPEAVRRRAETFGASGLAWLTSLDQTVNDLEQQWEIATVDVLAGGSESLVISATTVELSPVVVKIGLPGSADLSTEARVYRLADGRGYARLLAEEPAVNAILLEQLGGSLGSTGMTTDQLMVSICATLQKAWVNISDSNGFMSGSEKADWLAEFINSSSISEPRHCSHRAIHRALDYIEERKDAFSPQTSVLVHGDAHEFNTLRPNGRDAILDCRFIDPDGLYAEKACDLGVLMRDWSTELLAGDTLMLGAGRALRLSELTGVPAEAIWQWGFIERVSTSFVLSSIGMTNEAAEMIRVAEVFAEAPGRLPFQ